MASNFLMTSSYENLGPDHPIRRLLRPHTYGAVKINRGATQTLATERGLLHRASALTWPALKKAFRVCFDLVRFEHINQTFTRNGMDGAIASGLYPFGQDTKAFVQILETYVHAYVDVYYTDDAAIRDDRELVAFWNDLGVKERSQIPELSGKRVLVGGLSMFILYVTGLHNHVGNVADYLVDPTFASPKIRTGSELADIQAAFQGLNIGLMTAMVRPKLINNWFHILLPDEHLPQTSAILETFQNELKALSDKIDRLNEQREMPCNALNPRLMLSSVSI